MRSLYHTPLSPFCRKVRMLLMEKSLEFDAVQENSSLVGPLQPCQDSQQGSLAATGGAEERNEFSRLCM